MIYQEVLKVRHFRNLWVGQAVSQLGDSLYYLIFMFMVNELTGSSAMVGYVGALEALPFFLLGPYAGAVADRLDRRKIMLASDWLSGAILFGLAIWIFLEPKPPVAVIFAAAFCLSSVKAFFMPAKNAAVPNLVPAEKLMEANSLSSATQNVMPMLGLALSGSILGALYLLYPNGFFLTAILFNAVTFVFSAICVQKLPTLIPDRDGHAVQGSFAESIEGLRFALKDHLLRVALILVFFLHLFIAPFFVVYVEANKQWFGGGFATLAWCEFAFAAGMVAGSLLIGRFKIKRPGLSYGLGLGLIGLFVALMAVSRNYGLFVFWNVLCGLAVPFVNVPFHTYLQLVVPDAYLGRVNSAWMMLSMGVMPLGMMLAGVLLARFGLFWMFMGMGIGIFGACFLSLLDPVFRNIRMPQPQAEEHALLEREIVKS